MLVMFKRIGKVILLTVFFLIVLEYKGELKEEIITKAATKLPDNQEIEQLSVTWMNSNIYSIDVGKRKGTLLIRIDPPKVERDVEWLNHSITKPTLLNFALYNSLQTYDEDHRKFVISFTTGLESYIVQNGIHRDHHKYEGDRALSDRLALQKFSSYNYPNYYIGLAGYLDKSYSNDGKYYIHGSSYLLKEAGQVKPYFFENQNVTLEAYNRIADNGLSHYWIRLCGGKRSSEKDN